MRRAILAALGLALLVTSVDLAPRRFGTPSVAAALGRSLGGLRIAIVNGLFLQAESLRARGRTEEATSLYATVLELDPTNDAAFEHLAAVYAFDVLPEAIDAEERLSWWREGWDVAERGLRLRPRSARLLVRSHDLLRLAAGDPDLAGPVTTLVHGDPEILAFERLLTAARITDLLPRKGRAHIVWLALWTPQLAARRIAGHRPGADRFIAIGRETLEIRADVLERLPIPPDVMISSRDQAAYLREGLDVVEAVAAALAQGSIGTARAAVARYREAWPGSPLLDPLEDAVR